MYDNVIYNSCNALPLIVTFRLKQLIKVQFLRNEILLNRSHYFSFCFRLILPEKPAVPH